MGKDIHSEKDLHNSSLSIKIEKCRGSREVGLPETGRRTGVVFVPD